jgi:PncC family amidohydrolase
MTLALAESCTGGLIASLLTDIPGSSDYFLASLVTYSNDSKEKLLGVSPATLRKHGAVSEQTAREMAAGARRAAGATIGISVTGIAGPGGGSAEKPVGLVHFALDDGKRQVVDRIVFPGDRLAIKRGAAEHALSVLISYLERPSSPTGEASPPPAVRSAITDRR